MHDKYDRYGSAISLNNQILCAAVIKSTIIGHTLHYLISAIAQARAIEVLRVLCIHSYIQRSSDGITISISGLFINKLIPDSGSSCSVNS